MQVHLVLCMEFLKFLETLRNPVLDAFFSVVTRLGEETLFILAGLVFFWCIDKKKGYFIMSVGFIGTMANNVLKLICRVPRPWVLDKNFTILEQAREAAAGYSFPSGHSQTAVGTFGALALTAKKKWVKILSVIIMYIGRLGPLTIATLWYFDKGERVRYPYGNIAIG